MSKLSNRVHLTIFLPLTATATALWLWIAAACPAVGDSGGFRDLGVRGIPNPDRSVDSNGTTSTNPSGSRNGAAVSSAERATARMMRKMALEESNTQLYQQMLRVSGWLDQYLTWNHRWPEVGDETAWAQEQLNQQVPNNPFTRDKVQLIAGLDADPSYVSADSDPTDPSPSPELSPSGDVPGTAANLNHIRIQIDTSLTALEIQQYLDDPPQEWTAPPGTITAISNFRDLFVVWGAGADGKPLRDLASNKVKLLEGNYRMYNYE